MVRILIRTSFYISLFAFTTCIELKGQEDSIIDQNSTIINSTVGKKNSAKQSYLDENLREEKTLLKFYFQPFFDYEKYMDAFGGFSSSFSYEHKIVPSLSILLSNDLNFGFGNSRAYWGTEGNFELRYYYLVRKKIKESIGANNFHNNYFAISINKLYSYQYVNARNWVSNGNTYNFNDDRWFFEPTIAISWGMQRRIKKWGFYDIEPYFIFPRDGVYHYGVKLRLGLAWGF